MDARDLAGTQDIRPRPATMEQRAAKHAGADAASHHGDALHGGCVPGPDSQLLLLARPRRLRRDGPQLDRDRPVDRRRVAAQRHDGATLLLLQDDDPAILTMVPFLDIYQALLVNCAWVIAGIDELRRSRMSWS